MLNMNHKGNLFDMVFIIVVLFGAAISMVVMYMFLDKFQTAMPNTLNLNASIVSQGKAALNIFDWGILSLFIGAALFSVISAYFIRSSPVFFIIGVISLMIITYGASLISNVSYYIFMTGPLASYSGNFPITMSIFQYLPVEVLVLGILIMIAMFSKSEDQNAAMY